MAEWFIFPTPDMGDFGADIDLLNAVWEGKEPGTTLLDLAGQDEPILISIPFDTFVRDHLDHYDLRPKRKKKPRPAKAKRGKAMPYLRLVN